MTIGEQGRYTKLNCGQWLVNTIRQWGYEGLLLLSSVVITSVSDLGFFHGSGSTCLSNLGVRIRISLFWTPDPGYLFGGKYGDFYIIDQIIKANK